MSGIVDGIGKLIGLGLSLFVLILVLWALAPAFSSLFDTAPQPAGAALSTVSTFQDASDVAAVVLDMVAVVGGIVGIAFTKDARLGLAVIGVLFVIFLVTGL